MIPKHHQRYYAFVWPIFWPWLWLQLWRLERWQRQTGRGVLIAVDRRGNVYIRSVADEKKPGVWRYEAPIVPAWERPALGSDMPEEFLELGAPASDGRAVSCAAHVTGAPLYLNFDTS